MLNKVSEGPETRLHFKYNQSRVFESLLENLQGVVYCKLYDQQLSMIYISDGIKQLAGYDPEDLIYNRTISYQEIKYEGDRERVQKIIENAVLKHSSFKVEYRIKHTDGRLIWVKEHGNAVYDSDGQPLALEGYIESITKRKDTEIALSNAENRYQSIFENSLHGIFQTTLSGNYEIVNPALARIYGYESPQALINDLNDINKQLYVSPTRRDEFIEIMNAEGMVTNFESQVYTKDKDIVWISEHARSVYDDFGEFLYYEGTVTDITELKTTKAALKISETLEKNAMEELHYQKYALDKHAIVSIADLDGNITYVNDKFCEVSGYARGEVMGKNHRILNSGYHPKAYFTQMFDTISQGRTWTGEVCNKSKDGRIYWLDMTIVPYLNDDGKPTKYICIRTDITQRKQAEKKSKFLALYDPLTKLPNKNLLNDRLTHACVASKRSGKQCALLYIDVDHFKKLNDTLGHELGDLMLQQVAQRISASLREVDTVSRVGGDEFVVLLEGLSETEATAAAQAKSISQKLIQRINQPYTLTDHEFHTSASIGMVTFGGQQQSYKTIVQCAEIAMYEAKNDGRNASCLYDPLMHDQIIEKVALERELRQAITQDELVLYYQLQVSGAGKPIGAEALLRWKHPKRGLVSPIEFIPLAEETGLIYPIGEMVLETACKQLKAWEGTEFKSGLSLSVNVSAKQFYQAGFVEQVQSTIQRSGINPRKLKLELTESMLLDNIELTIKKMNALLRLGISFSLDDFGTGYSSLQYLKRLPIYQLKIDRSFINDITHDKNDQAIVRTIAAMASTLNLTLIAEGVETDEQQQLLSNIGYMDYQGYLFGKPMPLDLFEMSLYNR